MKLATGGIILVDLSMISDLTLNVMTLPLSLNVTESVCEYTPYMEYSQISVHACTEGFNPSSSFLFLFLYPTSQVCKNVDFCDTMIIQTHMCRYYSE